MYNETENFGFTTYTERDDYSLALIQISHCSVAIGISPFISFTILYLYSLCLSTVFLFQNQLFRSI